MAQADEVNGNLAKAVVRQSEMHHLKREILRTILAGVFLSVMVFLGILFYVEVWAAGEVSANQKIEDRVDRNAQVTRSGIEALVCILVVDPSERQPQVVSDCVERAGFDRYTDIDGQVEGGD